MSVHWGGPGAGHVSRWSVATTGVPVLSLDFLSGTILDRRITFSRTTNATLVDATGKLTYAPNNLVTNSEAFENAAWTKAGAATIGANVIAAPNGTFTADILNGSSPSDYVAQSPSYLAGSSYTHSCYVKAGAGGVVTLRGSTAVFGVEILVNYNLSTGVATVASGSPSTFGAIDTGNGWWRCWFSATASATASAQFQIRPSTGSIYLWGAQLEQVTYQTAPSVYNSTSPANLLGFTEEFDNAAWTKSSATVTANATIAPDGTTNADALIENTAVSAFHYMVQSVTKSAANIPVAGSFYLKNKGRQVSFSIQNAAGSSGVGARVNPATGTVTQNATAFGSGFTAGTISITDVGNGWYRVAMTATTDTTTIVGFQFVLHNGTSTVYTGDGVSGAFLWGVQLSNSASVDPYVYNPAAAPTSIAYYGPRFDYNPTTLAANGLLIEEQRTNGIRNNTGVGTVTGTPGTTPTNWSVSPSGGGVTREVVGTGLENGVAYVDIKYSGTPTASAALSIAFEAANVIAATSGQTWSHSAYLKLQAGSFTGTQTTLSTLGTNGTAGTESFATADITSTPSNLAAARISLTSTLANATTTFVQPRIRIAVTIGVPMDLTLRIGLPQLELGAFATSVIPTATAQVTRAADIVSMLGSNFSSWYNQSAGTFVSQFTTRPNAVVLVANDGTFNNRLPQLSIGVASAYENYIVSGGSVVATLIPAGTQVFGTPAKVAVAYALDNYAAAANGGTVATDTSGVLPTGVNSLYIGRFQNGTSQMSGYIRAFTYYPARLTDAQLQALTA